MGAACAAPIVQILSRSQHHFALIVNDPQNKQSKGELPDSWDPGDVAVL